jgi:uncharacterized protein YjbI with pentapeptide repeats
MNPFEKMSNINNINEFIEHYNKGLRLFIGLEFENGESFSGLDISGTTFKNCWFCADFSDTNLTDCKFIECNIKTSNFSNANLTRALINRCSYEATEFHGANITDFRFEENYAYGNDYYLDDFKKIYGFD